MSKRNPLSFQIDVDKFSLVNDDEKLATNLMRPNSTFFIDGVKRFVKNPVAMVSFIFVILLILASFIVPLFYPYQYDEIIAYRYSSRMSSEYIFLQPMQYSTTEQALIAQGQSIFPHLLGTDREGHDFFIRLLVGTRTSLLVGFFAAIIVLIIGGTIGSLCGYIGGKLDLIVMRIVDVIYSLPDILIIILLSTVISGIFDDGQATGFFAQLGSGFVSIFVVFALLYWVGMARLVRGQILTLRKCEYVMAAKASGATTGRIIRKHLLPNTISVIIISAALQIPSAIFTESFLSYLGLGVQYPTPSLGYLAADGKGFIIGNSDRLYMFMVPAIMICLIVLSLNLLGDGLRDAFDPKLSK